MIDIEHPEDIISRVQDRIALMFEQARFEFEENAGQMGDFEKSVLNAKLSLLDDTYKDLKQALTLMFRADQEKVA